MKPKSDIEELIADALADAIEEIEDPRPVDPAIIIDWDGNVYYGSAVADYAVANLGLVSDWLWDYEPGVAIDDYISGKIAASDMDALYAQYIEATA